MLKLSVLSSKLFLICIIILIVCNKNIFRSVSS